MLKYLLEKEFKQIFRNAFLLRMLIIMPLMTIVLYPYVTNQEVRNLKLSVVDHDHSVFSSRLIRKADASAYFQLVSVSSYAQALGEVESGDADIILEIPRDFERDMQRGEPGQVMLSANSVDGTRGALGSQYLSSIIADFGTELREEAGITATPQLRLSATYRFNPTLDYKIFMIPGLIVVLLTLLCCALTALNIVGEKEAGTIEQINVTPVPKSLFILGKLLPNWIIGLFALTFGMTFAWAIHGLVPAGSLLTILLFAGCYILAASGMGMVISNYSSTMQQAMFVMFFFLIILLLTSGLFTPIASMPGWMQACTVVNPLKYLAEVMRLVYLKGSGTGEMLPQLFALCSFAVVFNVWAVVSYRKSL